MLEWYRLRWQVELVFKRFKSLAQLGHVPKYDDDSAKAWLYGKLFVACWCYLPLLAFVSFDREAEQYLCAAVPRPGKA